MTNINCVAKCIYQRDGKCSYNIVSMSEVSQNSDCAYFIPYYTNISFPSTNPKQMKTY